MGEPGHGNFDTLHFEEASLPPDFFEFESFHHQGEVDLKLSTLASNQRAARYDLLRQKSIEGTPQRLVAEPEPEAGCFAGLPRPERVARVGREKQIPVLRGKKEPG
jgi:hypothetical protein